MTKVTRNVILDLLPLYLAGEVNEDTAAFVRAHLETDQELAELAEQMKQTDSINAAPAPRSKETEMEAFERTKQMLIIRSTIVITIVAMLLCTLGLVLPLAIFLSNQ